MIMITAWYVRTGELQESHIFLQKTEKRNKKIVQITKDKKTKIKRTK